MFDVFRALYQGDWHIFMNATHRWWQGQSPYGVLSPEIGTPGAFAYPPTSLTWLSVFALFGSASFFVWSLLQLGAWFWLMRRSGRASQAILLAWAPVAIHLLIGQITLGFILALWYVYLCNKRSWLCGFILAFALSKPQTALLPVAWLLWHTRHDKTRYALWGGIAIGTLILALPPTLRDPGIWKAWLVSMKDYNDRAQFNFAWQRIGVLIVTVAAWLWHRQSQRRKDEIGSTAYSLENIWPWWLTMALFPYASIYPAVTLIPIMRPQRNYWSIAGLLLSSCLISPVNSFTLPLFLSGHILAAWFINGGPRSARIHAGADSL